jgi:hypothetical protein
MGMTRAIVLIRELPQFRREAFSAGLRAHGYDVKFKVPERYYEGDVLCTWNRYGLASGEARRAENAKATVLVSENGYLGRTWRDQTWYAIARSRHNGAGQWHVGGPRWSTWNVPIVPWREDGKHILVLPQRGFGEPPVAQPKEWLGATLKDLSRRTKRPVIVRHHPGERATKPLEEDLRDAWACVTWASGAAIKAIAAGVPVFHSSPTWIGAGAARPLSSDIEQPFLGDRTPMFEALSWAMWNVDEIGRGEPFAHLLGTSEQLPKK